MIVKRTCTWPVFVRVLAYVLVLATASALVSCGGGGSSVSNSASTVSTTAPTIPSPIGGGPPKANSVTAVAVTAQSNAQCTAIAPFYWEIGEASGALSSGSAPQSGAASVVATTKFSIASASKWIYGTYVLQIRKAAGNLSAAQIKLLNFTSGYTYMGTSTVSATCTAPGSGANSINYCLTLPSPTAGKLNSSQNSVTDGVFDYGSGHLQNHAGQFQPEISNLDTSVLGDAIAAGLNLNAITFKYNQPLLAGGIVASANDYTPVLRAMLSGQLSMLGALGTNAVCAWVGAGCNAAYSPITTERWHYSMAHWVEDDPISGDGAFSSPGAFGFYPWIDVNKRFYGVISRYAPTGTGTENGAASARCGRALRAAWETGVQR